MLLQVSAQLDIAQKIELGKLKNLYQLNDSIFRSEQPNKKEFIANYIPGKP